MLLGRLLLLLPSVVGVYGFPALVMIGGHELTWVESVIKQQTTGGRLVLHGPSYSNRARSFKLKSVIARAPRVIALGTSRVMQFRSAMFKRERFYNAGGGVETIWELRPFLRQIPHASQPEVILVGLDQWLFNPDSAEFRKSRPVTTNATGILQAAKLNAYADYWAGKFTLAGLFRSNDDDVRLGLNAIANGNGFRNDGSYLYGGYIADPASPKHEDFEFRDTFRRMATGTDRFEYGPHVSAEVVTELDEFLEECQQRRIYVVGILPPFPHAVFLKLTAMKREYGYLSEVTPSVAPVFARHGYGFFDFSDLATVGASDVEIIDGFHGSETAYLRLLIAMLKSDSVLAEHAADPGYLETRLKAASPYQVFRNDEY